MTDKITIHPLYVAITLLIVHTKFTKFIFSSPIFIIVKVSLQCIPW